MNNPVPTAAGGAARGRGATFSISISLSLSPSYGGGRGEVGKMLNSYGVLMDGGNLATPRAALRLHGVIHVIPPLGVKEGVVEKKSSDHSCIRHTLFSGTRKKDLAKNCKKFELYKIFSYFCNW
jgi:hypothetical protein